MKTKIITIVASVLLLVTISKVSSAHKPSGLQGVVYQWGELQEDTSDELTHAAVDGAEGTVVGGPKVNGSNWSIPNLIRNWVGVE